MGVFLFYLVIGALIAFAIWFAMRAYAQADSKTIVGAAKVAGLAVGGAFVVWLAISGRLGQALMLAAALTPLLLRWKSIATSQGPPLTLCPPGGARCRVAVPGCRPGR